MKYKHKSFNLDKLVNEADIKELEYLFCEPGDEVREKLRFLQESGHRIVTNVFCSNFCPQTGCKGHSDQPDNTNE